MSTGLLNTCGDGDLVISLGSFFQCLVTFLVKNFLLISNLNLPSRNLRLFPLVLSLGTWETNTHLAITFSQVVVRGDKVSLQPAFLQVKQVQFSQPLLTGLVLWTVHQLHCSSLDTLQQVFVLLTALVMSKNAEGLSLFLLLWHS